MHSHHANRPSPPSRLAATARRRARRRWFGWLCVILLAMTALAAAPTQAAEPVGEVTLLIGSATATAPDGERRDLAMGAAVYAEDVITTPGNGHVHLRFIDDARVSVRPDSRLVLHTYVFNPRAAEQSRIRFDLDSGAARAISGEGAESARDRYRFNTPLAAIGVRGTDFTVTVAADRVRAFVNQGAIAMAPFSASCQVNALGPCQGAAELTGGSDQVLEIGRDDREMRRLQLALDDALGVQRANGHFAPGPATDSTLKKRRAPESSSQEAGAERNGPNGPDQAAQAEHAKDAEPASRESPVAEQPPEQPPEQTKATEAGAATEASEDGRAASSGTPTASSAAFEAEEAVAEPTAKRTAQSASESTSERAPDTPAEAPKTWFDSSERLLSPDSLLLARSSDSRSLPPVADRQLAWGRWKDTASLPDFVLDNEVATDGRVTRVRTRDMVLARREPEGASLDIAPLGQVAFQLDAASAVLNQPGGSSPMAVNSGVLNIDFANRDFITALDLEHADTGVLRFTMQGDVSRSGVLIGTSREGTLVGASSLDGAEAAYYFQHRLDQGGIEGTTLWGRQ